ncbi:hypothetical protein VTL71DRAFT_2224 [Oculimacula yallundae]|uniref:Uncharacterized protein n=1 Tax=Oculimacula yallundae TaxID=86028 RepID=A0ABR4C8A6_9HELO
MKVAAISLIFALLSISTVEAQFQSPNNCTIFTWDKQPAYYTYGPPERISGATTCAPKNNESHYCGLTAEGDIQVSYSKNISVFADSCWRVGNSITCWLESIIKPAINESLAGQQWNQSVIASIDNTAAIEPGVSAYLNFTTLKRCFVGTLSNCTGNMTDGDVIEACAPVYHTDGRGRGRIMDGEVIVVNISESDVGNFRDPFANQVSGSEAEGAAERLFLDGNVMGLGLVVAFAVMLL